MPRYSMISAPDFFPVHMLREVQNEKFMTVFKHVYTNVQWYRDLLEKNNVNPDSIKSIDDISKLPFIKKTDLRDTYPNGMFAASMTDISRFQASSGTTGKPIVLAYTKSDVNIWAESTARALTMYGIDEHDILQVAYGYGLFTGGLGLHYGGEYRGCAVVPASGGNTERQLMLIRDLGVTAFACTPTYFLHLIDYAQKIGYDWKQTKLRVGAFGAEPWTEEMRDFIDESTGIKAYDIYGLTETAGPGVAGNCFCREGLHIFEDHFYPEIVNQETLEPVPDGEYGELVFTTLDKVGMPLLRYRTRDITRIINEPCVCGRTIRRMERISHRTDDMMIIRGVNVFPSQVESILLSVDPALVNYQLILEREASGMDSIEVKVEMGREKFAQLGDNVTAVENFRRQIADKLKHIIGINFKTTLCEPDTVPRSEGKMKRIIDNRKK
ncbi:MAG: phenylacetate--CoA ligase [Planctomycetia bacterium]|nr:phenylacetate--CoA ligase [Planctomycetia bacterium]